MTLNDFEAIIFIAEILEDCLNEVDVFAAAGVNKIRYFEIELVSANSRSLGNIHQRKPTIFTWKYYQTSL
ncbi:MAG: hypothetical protein M3Y53_08485 [Thermoproteota archaeon]|nr:hypothetical protein [Thermoproteota archaeon]